MGLLDSLKNAIFSDGDDDEDDDMLYEKEMQELERKNQAKNSRSESRSERSESRTERSSEVSKPYVRPAEPEKPSYKSYESSSSIPSYSPKKIEEVKNIDNKPAPAKKPDFSSMVPKKEDASFPSITKITPPRSPESTYSTPPAPLAPRTQVDVADVSGYVVTSFSDAQMICDRLAHNKATIVNFEKINTSEAQRIMDFICGCLYVLDGNLQAVTSSVYIFTPKGMDISGDFASMIKNNSFGVPTFNKML